MAIQYINEGVGGVTKPYTIQGRCHCTVMSGSEKRILERVELVYIHVHRVLTCNE